MSEEVKMNFSDLEGEFRNRAATEIENLSAAARTYWDHLDSIRHFEDPKYLGELREDLKSLIGDERDEALTEIHKIERFQADSSMASFLGYEKHEKLLPFWDAVKVLCAKRQAFSADAKAAAIYAEGELFKSFGVGHQATHLMRFIEAFDKKTENLRYQMERHSSRRFPAIFPSCFYEFTGPQPTKDRPLTVLESIRERATRIGWEQYQDDVSLDLRRRARPALLAKERAERQAKLAALRAKSSPQPASEAEIPGAASEEVQSENLAHPPGLTPVQAGGEWNEA